MADIQNFFDACQTGKGWQQCQKYCHQNAIFECDVLPMTTLKQYTEWMKNLIINIIPDAKYELISVTTNQNQKTTVFCATFYGTHTLKGGPIPPSQPPKSTKCDYSYIIKYDNNGKISKMHKIWDIHTAFKQLGWPLN